jgi:hypothetical protein
MHEQITRHAQRYEASRATPLSMTRPGIHRSELEHVLGLLHWGEAAT